MRKEWFHELAKNSPRLTQDQENKFLSLVNEAFESCDLEVARALMKTFSNKPDYGTQERVISALSTATNEIYAQVLIEELPRLFLEAYDWIESLLGPEVEKRELYIINAAKDASYENKKILLEVLSNEDFQSFYPNATHLLSAIKNNHG